MGKAKRIFLIFSLCFLAVVVGLVYVSNHTQTEEEKIIEFSKKVLAQYAPDYEYLDAPEKWMVIFNDADGEGTITVWSPAKEPDAQDNALRGCVMFERQSDKITVSYVEVDHVEMYRLDPQ